MGGTLSYCLCTIKQAMSLKIAKEFKLNRVDLLKQNEVLQNYEEPHFFAKSVIV